MAGGSRPGRSILPLYRIFMTLTYTIPSCCHYCTTTIYYYCTYSCTCTVYPAIYAIPAYRYHRSPHSIHSIHRHRIAHSTRTVRVRTVQYAYCITVFRTGYSTWVQYRQYPVLTRFHSQSDYDVMSIEAPGSPCVCSIVPRWFRLILSSTTTS